MLKKRPLPSLLLLLCLFFSGRLAAQTADSVYNKIFNFPNKLFSGVDEKASKLEAKFNKQTEKYLQRLARQEQKLKKQLYKKDSAAANKIFAQSQTTYDQLEQQLKNPVAKTDPFRNVYDGHLDSLKTSLKFLEKENISSLSPALQQQFSKTLGQLDMLQGKLNQADQIKKILQQRQEYLKRQLQNFGLTKAYKKFQKDVYYYQQQVQEYKDLLDDPTKLEKRVLQVAQKMPAFQKFFANHSELAGLFQLPGSDPMGAIDMGALQTRSMIEASARERLGNTLNMNGAIEDNRQSADGQVQALKSNLQSLKSGQFGSDKAGQPDFKPNQQKTKSLKDRLEFGSNLQTVRASYYFPATSDMGLSLGYKLNDKSVIGLGLSGKIGLGTGWNHIALSYQGVGVRQFVDLKLKGSLWVSGGAEMNYRTAISSVEALKQYSNWQQSALIGLSKKIKAGKMKSQVQILYDFLWKQQVPVTQPVLFRLGYNF